MHEICCTEIKCKIMLINVKNKHIECMRGVGEQTMYLPEKIKRVFM